MTAICNDLEVERIYHKSESRHPKLPNFRFQLNIQPTTQPQPSTNYPTTQPQLSSIPTHLLILLQVRPGSHALVLSTMAAGQAAPQGPEVGT